MASDKRNLSIPNTARIEVQSKKQRDIHNRNRDVIMNFKKST